MHVLITGGAGFIGARVGQAMVERGFHLTVLDLQLDRPAPWWSAPGVRVVEGDLRDRATVANVMEGVDACWHLAAAHHDSGIAEETYFSVNEEGTRILCQEMTRQRVQDMCFFSSVAVYGPREDRERPSPENSYGRSKLAGERVVADWARQSGGKAFIVRPAVVFGVDNFANTFALMRQIHGGVFWPVGAGANVKSMAYVENLVPAVLERWLGMAAGETQTLNYVDKPDLTSARIADAVSTALGKRVPRPAIPAIVARVLLTPADAIGSLLGRQTNLWLKVSKFSLMETSFSSDFEGRGGIALEQALADTVDWYVEQGRFQPARRAIPPSVARTGYRDWSP